MARKKLLTEGEIRQFMKLANLGPLSETYLSNNPLQEQPEEEWAEEEEEEVVDEPEMAPEPPLDMGDMGDEGGEDEDLLARVVRAVADELGVEVDIEGEEEGGEEDLEDIEDIEGIEDADVEGGEWEVRRRGRRSCPALAICIKKAKLAIKVAAMLPIKFPRASLMKKRKSLRKSAAAKKAIFRPAPAARRQRVENRAPHQGKMSASEKALREWILISERNPLTKKISSLKSPDESPVV